MNEANDNIQSPDFITKAMWLDDSIIVKILLSFLLAIAFGLVLLSALFGYAETKIRGTK